MDIELGGQTYRIGRLNARDQFHIVRRLASVLGELLPALRGARPGDDQAIEAFGPMADAIGRMSDDDADYCLFGLLRVVQRREGKGLGWSQIVVPGGSQLMYDDISMASMLRLAWESLRHNLSDFFAALPSASSDEAQKPNEQ